MEGIKQRTVFLVGICILGFFILFVLGYQSYTVQTSTPHVFRFTVKDPISTISFIYEGKKKSVQRVNGRWYTKDPFTLPADETRINKLIEVIKTLKKTTIVSHNTKKHTEFGITSNRLEIRTKSNIYRLYIGRGNYTKNYLRMDDEDIIFEEEGLDNVFDPFDYRNLSVPFVQKENRVNMIDIVWEGNRTKLNREGDEWKVNGKKGLRDRIDYLINALATLRATDILKKEGSEKQLSSPILEITVKEDKKNKELTVYEKDETTGYVTTTTSPFIFVIPQVYLDSVEKEESQFMGTE